MKKEYKAPIVSFVNAEVETPMMSHSNFAADSKKSGRTFEDEESAPAATPKGFWDDEE